MAFGVKWNEDGEENGRRTASPGGREPLAPSADPGADAEAARRAGRLQPPARPQTGREGGEGEGEGRSRQPFSLTVQNTQTRSRDAGSENPDPDPRGGRPPNPGPGAGG